MPHCPNPKTLAGFPAGDPQAEHRAEWKAGEARVEQPETHVHFSPLIDAFLVVTPRPAPNEDMEIEL